ncbi:anaphase-promoting complex subunit 2 [Trichonephila clavipes]|nr:anaphase-promoting complex subunit 2 [Trichonephila clavipes]
MISYRYTTEITSANLRLSQPSRRRKHQKDTEILGILRSTSREDTVRCIIFSLREDSCGELACELLKGVSVKFEDPFTNDEEGDNWEKWSPDPVDADPAKTTDSQRSSDIIGILVNIYGSKELFVNEYRSLLADRILTTFSYNTDKELRYLEMLKLRFGESQLHCCEVMLKDIADSKRINSTLNSGEVKTYEQGDFPINSMILSAQFWPSFKEEKLKLPEYIWQNLKKYTTAFEALKGNRSLTWKSHLGSVDLEIELKGRTLSLSVSPVHATILWHFQEKSKWSITELSSEMQIQPSVLRRKITLWQNHGVLSETESDVFELIEEQQTVNREAMVVIEEEEESVTASSQDMKEEELQTFWSFIVGMLTNMESLPLERIHSMLRMFAVQGTSTNECSIHDMRQFLEKKVRDRQLVYSAGMFKLPKYET